MNDSRTLRVLGRDHANAILSGVSSASSRKNSKAVPTGMQYYRVHRNLSFCMLFRIHFFWLFIYHFHPVAHTFNKSSLSWSMSFYETDTLKRFDEFQIDIGELVSVCDSSEDDFNGKSNDLNCCLFIFEICSYLLLTLILIAAAIFIICQYYI